MSDSAALVKNSLRTGWLIAAAAFIAGSSLLFVAGIDNGPAVLAYSPAVLAIICGGLALALSWQKPKIRPWRPVAAIAGGTIGGAVGLALGFFGPLWLTPNSSQGPLLGIFLTGPLGTLCGLLLALCLCNLERAA